MSSSNGSRGSAGSDPPSGATVPRGGVMMKLLAGIGVASTLALFGFLVVFAFTGGDTRNPDELDQIFFVDSALMICDRHQAAILALTPAQDITSPAERADVLDQANLILEAMIAELRLEAEGRDVIDDLPDARSDDLAPVDQAVVDAGTLSAEDADNLGRWLVDYESFLGDRQAHSVRLREEGDVRFLVTDKDGSPISVWIDGYARVNDMESCEVPLDL